MAVSCALLAVLLFAPPQDFLAEGLKALDANQPAAAEPLLRQAVQSDPSDFSAHFNLALALSLQQKDAEAIQELRRTLELKPGLYQADSNLGTLLLRNRRPAEALPVLKEAGSPASRRKPRAESPLRPGALRNGRRGTGRAVLSQPRPNWIPSPRPRSGDSLTVLLKESKLAESAEHFRAAAALDPQYKDGLLEVAAEYEKSKMIPEAVAIYKEFPENAAREGTAGAALDHATETSPRPFRVSNRP